MGVTAEEAFALEDSLNGVLPAKSAGLLCVAVSWTMTKNLSFDRADMRNQSLEETSLEELLEALV